MSWNTLVGPTGFFDKKGTSPLLMPWHTDVSPSNASVVLIKKAQCFVAILIKVHLEHSENFFNDWSKLLYSWWCLLGVGNHHTDEKKQSVNYFQGLETEILRWFTDDSDFCVSLLLYLLPRELGAYFLPHHDYKKYQQKPQENNFSTPLLKMADKLNVSYTRETEVLSV